MTNTIQTDDIDKVSVIYSNKNGIEENLSDEDKDGVLDDFDACPGTIQGQSVDDFGCVLSSDENKQEENKEQEKDTENYDSGPVVESLEEESEISSLGLVTVLLPIVLIAIFRRK